MPVLNTAKPYIKINKSDKLALDLKDKDSSSEFFFRCSLQDNNKQFVVEMYPAARDHIVPTTTRVNVGGLTDHLKSWITILIDFTNLETIYDDPIVKKYEEEFTEYFEMTDADADKVPFDLPRQLYIDTYLTNVVKLLELKKEGVSEEKAEELSEIIEDCQVLQENLTELTKNETVSKLSKILAKARKAGLSFIKDFLSDLKKEGFKFLAKTAFENGGDIIDTVYELM